MIRMILFTLSIFFFPNFTYADQSKTASFSKACTTSESWDSSAKWMGGYIDFASGKNAPLYGFSDALNLKRLSQLMSHSDFERDFSEYWVGRVLFNLGLDFVAQQAFTSVYENSAQPQIRKAALVCLGEIQKRSADLKVPSQIHSSLVGDLSDKKEMADVVLLSLLQNLGQNFSPKLANQLPAAHQNLALGIQAAKQKKFTDVIKHLQLFTLSAESSSGFLKTFLDQSRLLLARAFYSTGKFGDAEKQFQMVSKTSNWVIDAMSDLSWAYLQNNHYDDVLGIAVQLRVGSFRNAFAPEAMMVAAMALNERCLFPESIKMINSFNFDYASTYEWLNKHQNNVDVYSEVLKVLKKSVDKTTVPAKITSEWLKNPLFLDRQLEINALVSHPAQLAKFQEQAYLDQIKMTDATNLELTAFIKEVKIANLRLKPGQELDDSLGSRYIILKKKLRKLSKYGKASKTWKSLAKNYEKRIPQIRAKLVSSINKDLNKSNEDLLGQLERIQENTELIEIEIFNGASHDIVWQNAHPDFEKVSKKIDDDKETPNSSAVWSWGRHLASELDDAEVWEDEVGSLKADLTDQCSKKGKYLSLKLKKH